MNYQVVHTTTGRCRIRIPQLAKDADYASQLNRLVESLDFVTTVRINPAASSLIVTYEASGIAGDRVPDQLLSCIAQANETQIYQPEILAETDPLDRPQVDHWEHLGLPFLSLGLALLATPLEIPPLIIGTAIAGAAIPWFTRAAESMITHRQVNVDLLDSVWITLHTLNGQYVAPSLKTSMVGGRRTLRGMTAEHLKQQSRNRLPSCGEYARLDTKGPKKQVLLSEIGVGDCLIVSGGQVIPVDGQIIEGTALIDESPLRDDTTPVLVKAGERVYAACRVLDGQIGMVAQRIGEHTRIGIAHQIIQTQPVYDTQIGVHQAEFAKTAVVPTLCLGATIFALTGVYSRSIAPFQLDFGSGIQITMPTALLAALTYAACHGVYIRSGRILEVLAQTDTIIFDQAGTLTQGNPVVVGIQTAKDLIAAAQVLALAASAAQNLTHPLAKAIVGYATALGVQMEECASWDYESGMGIVAQINNTTIRVGSRRFLQQGGVDLDHQIDLEPIGDRSLIYVAQDRELIGIIFYSDPLRKESQNTINSLRLQGITSYLLSEDNQQVANQIARQVGIDQKNIYAAASPEKKIGVVQGLHDDGKTIAYVGDGMNDLAAFASADLSISFASSSDLTTETADVVLLDQDLGGIPDAIEIARHAMQIVYQNTALIVIPNLIVVIGGVFFGLHPAVAVLTNNCSASIAEFLNSTRPPFGSGIAGSRSSRKASQGNNPAQLGETQELQLILTEQLAVSS
jgi:heavy metal translocating P-type ATPase